MEKTFAEFFAGIGLVRLGLERAGWKAKFANDIDEKKLEMYWDNFEDAVETYLLGDIHDLCPDQIPSVTLATASFPCNDLSLAGARNGLSGQQSSAFWGLIRLLEGMRARRPALILLENVTGFLTSRGGADFREALHALNELGYCVDAFILDAKWFVPQSRQRLFVVGLQEPYGEADPRQIVRTCASEVRPKLLTRFIANHPGLRWRVEDLPAPPRNRTTLRAVIEDLPAAAPEWWSAERAAYLLNQMSSRHRRIAERMIAGPGISYGTVFRRVRRARSMGELRTDGLAGCLRTPRGGSGRQILFKAGKGKYSARLLTPRECARLMGAGDYNIRVPANQAYFGFGDAVCVPVMEWIGQNVLNRASSRRGFEVGSFATPT